MFCYRSSHHATDGGLAQGALDRLDEGVVGQRVGPAVGHKDDGPIGTRVTLDCDGRRLDRGSGCHLIGGHLWQFETNPVDAARVTNGAHDDLLL